MVDADVPRLVNRYFLSDIEGSKKWNASFADRSDYAAIRAYHSHRTLASVESKF